MHEHPAPEGRTNLAQRFSAGTSGGNDSSPGGTTELSRTPSGISNDVERRHSYPRMGLYSFSPLSASSAVKCFSGRSNGNRITSRIECESVSSIASRSTPKPTPPAGETFRSEEHTSELQ